MNQNDGQCLDPRNQSPADFLILADRISLSEKNARRWLALVIGKGDHRLEEAARQGILTKSSVNLIQNLPKLRLEKRLMSKTSGFQKLVFRTQDDLNVESVVIPLHKAGAFSICVSSQIGCALHCSYCSTGRMQTQRNLETWEIIDQFIQARDLVRIEGGRITGAVFMGMGEPFLNYDRVMAAAELLSYPMEAAISAKAITVSTVGLVPEIERFTSENRRYRLSISLGAASDEKRKILMPIAAQTPVADVMAAARKYADVRKTRVMLSYVCVSGINVTDEDARLLGELIGDTPARLDLIDVDDVTGRFSAPGVAELNGFRDALRRYLKQPVARRYSGGTDIRASCGALGSTELP